MYNDEKIMTHCLDNFYKNQYSSHFTLICQIASFCLFVRLSAPKPLIRAIKRHFTMIFTFYLLLRGPFLGPNNLFLSDARGENQSGLKSYEDIDSESKRFQFGCGTLSFLYQSSEQGSLRKNTRD